MIKRLTSTMSVRIFAIVIIGVLITASVVNMLRQRDFRMNESRIHGQFVLERTENALRILESANPEKREEIQASLSTMGNRVQLNMPVPKNLPALPEELLHLQQQLVPEVADAIAVSSGRECGRPRHMHHFGPPEDLPPPHDGDFHPGDFHPPPHEGEGPEMGHPPPRDFGPPPEFEEEKCLSIYTHLEDGTPLRINMRYGRRPPSLNRALIQPYMWVLMLAGLFLITWRVSHVATRPLRELANAARKLASNIEHPPLPENRGPVEVRHAATAFNEMQRSIVKHVQERAFILGAIAHDLQTPITRLRLRLEKIKDNELKQKLIDDLTATQEMVREGLDFARLCSENIKKSKVDLRALAAAVCDDFLESGHHITCNLPDAPLYIMGSPHLLKRCLTNLINNAITYAQRPALSINLHNELVYCTVSDDGPGIPEAELATILEPFRRVEDSRSRQTGGTGLGMSIARMIVEKHGGSISLSNKQPPLTGLVISISLPVN